MIAEAAAKQKKFDIFDFQKQLLEKANVKGYTELHKDETIL